MWIQDIIIRLFLKQKQIKTKIMLIQGLCNRLTLTLINLLSEVS